MLTSEAGFNLWTFCFKFLWLMIYKSKISNCSKPVSEEKNSAHIFLLLIFISSGLHVLPIFRHWLQKPWFHDASILIKLRMYFHLLYLQSIQLSEFFIFLFIHTHRPQEVSVWAGADHRSGGLVESVCHPRGSSFQGALGRIGSQSRWMCSGVLENALALLML